MLDFPESVSEERGADDLEGGPGDDRINPGTAGRPLEGDTLSGDAGHDTADYSTRTERLSIDLNGKNDDGEFGEHDNVQPGIECVDGGSEETRSIGSSAAECLDGHEGEDTIWGRGGDDTLEGGKNDPGGDNLFGESGSDTMSGGSGDDSLVGGEGDDYELGEGGADRVEGEAGNDRLLGGAGADAVDGGGGNDLVDGWAFLLIGGDGPDELIGGPGDDALFGRRGRDRLDGGGGSDSMSGGSESDTVTYEERMNRVFVTLDDKANDGERGERDNVRTDVEVVLGGIQDDNVFGDTDANTVDTGRGEDLITGRLGLDQLTGGGAPDIVRADDGDKDDVNCGDAEDLAIADGRDQVIDCETIDRPGARGPSVGRNARVRHEGVFRLRLPRGRRFFALAQNVKIPFGSTVDPKDDAVRLVTARNRAGGARSRRFSRPLRRVPGRRPAPRDRAPACGKAPRLPRVVDPTKPGEAGRTPFPTQAPRRSRQARSCGGEFGAGRSQRSAQKKTPRRACPGARPLQLGRVVWYRVAHRGEVQRHAYEGHQRDRARAGFRAPADRHRASRKAVSRALTLRAATSSRWGPGASGPAVRGRRFAVPQLVPEPGVPGRPARSAAAAPSPVATKLPTSSPTSGATTPTIQPALKAI